MRSACLSLTTPRTGHGRTRWAAVCLARLAALSAILVLAPAAHALEPSAPVKPQTPVKDPLVVVKAFRDALNSPPVRSAVDGEVLRQLRTVRPIAIVNGRWVTPIDLSRVYGIPAVKNVMLAGLAGHPVGGLLGNLPRDWPRYGLALTPNQVASIVMPDMVRDLMASVGVDAFRQHRTDVFGVDDVVELVALAVWGGIAFYEGYEGGTYLATPDDPHTGRKIDDPLADPDGDGIVNKDDPDDDNDGVPDNYDAYPYDPTKSFCNSCGGGGPIPTIAIGFDNRFSEQIMGGVILPGYRTAFQAFQARKTVAVGPLLNVGGRASGLQMVFPPGVR